MHRFCWHVTTNEHTQSYENHFVNHTFGDPSVLPTVFASVVSSFASWTWAQGVLLCLCLPPVFLLASHTTSPLLPAQAHQEAWCFLLVLLMTWAPGWLTDLYLIRVINMSQKTTFHLTSSVRYKRVVTRKLSTIGSVRTKAILTNIYHKKRSAFCGLLKARLITHKAPEPRCTPSEAFSDLS